ACCTCNQNKNNALPAEWLAELKRSRRTLNVTRAKNLERVMAGKRPALADAAAVNATRFAIGNALKAHGLPIVFGTGGRTRFNRNTQNYPKAHWIDAACVGETGERVQLNPAMRPLTITAMGRGQRQATRVDRYGFPRAAAKQVKRVMGFGTGDLVQLIQPAGRYSGTHTGRVSVRQRGAFDVQTLIGGAKVKITAPASRFTIIQRGDGYAHAA